MSTPSTWSSIKRFSLIRSRSHQKKKTIFSTMDTSPTPPESDTVSSSGSIRPAKVPKKTAEQPLGEIIVPSVQTIALLRAAGQPYEIVRDYEVPRVEGEDDVLVKTRVIGLNPIDWKAPDYNFAIPTLPYISGRESSGTVVEAKSPNSRFKPHDRVIVISTDYRDLRKATYQQYVIAPSFNLVRLPGSFPFSSAATLGVAYVASALALGVCLGVDFSPIHNGPNLVSLLQSIDPARIPADVRPEALSGIPSGERAQKGDFLVVWGASATSAHLTIQLAQLAGLRVVGVLDKAKHGIRVTGHGTLKPALWVDSHDEERAVGIIRRNTAGGMARFALDTIGAKTAAAAARAIGVKATEEATEEEEEEEEEEEKKTELELTPPVTPRTEEQVRIEGPGEQMGHLVGLSGVPKTATAGVKFHSVPIKLFHEVPEVGYALTEWLERLLKTGDLEAPDIIDVQKGFETLNSGLDRMRRGEISGGKLLVEVE